MKEKDSGDNKNKGVVYLACESRDFDVMSAKLNNSSSQEEFTQRIGDIVKRLGFSDFLFMRLERVWHRHSQSGMYHSLPDEWMRIYHEERLYEIDLVISYGRANIQPIFSSQIYGYINDAPFEMELTKKNRLVLQLYRRFDFFEHAVFPLPACDGNGHVVLLLSSEGTDKQSFQASVEPIIGRCRSLCRAIDYVANNSFDTTFVDKNNNPIKITNKTLSVLRELIYRDVSITQLAGYLNISPITAHQHIAAARKALSANTNIGAVVNAIKAGLVPLD